MLKRTFAIVFTLYVILSTCFVAAAEDPSKALTKSIADLDPSVDYKITLAVPDTGESFETDGKIGHITRLDMRDHVISPPSISRFEDWCSADGKGSIHATIVVPATNETFQLRTRGLADDLIVTRFFKLEHPFGKWYDKITSTIPKDDSITTGNDTDFFYHKPFGEEGWIEIESLSGETVSLLAEAVAKYEHKRPEIILHNHFPNILPPEAGSIHWHVYRKEDRIVVSATFGHYYTGNILFEFKKVRDHWEYNRMQVTEIFIGE